MWLKLLQHIVVGRDITLKLWPLPSLCTPSEHFFVFAVVFLFHSPSPFFSSHKGIKEVSSCVLSDLPSLYFLFLFPLLSCFSFSSGFPFSVKGRYPRPSCRASPLAKPLSLFLLPFGMPFCVPSDHLSKEQSPPNHSLA
jgi:hypothetical protein